MTQCKLFPGKCPAEDVRRGHIMLELLLREVGQWSVLQRSQCPPQACQLGGGELWEFDPQHGHRQKSEIRLELKEFGSSSVFWAHLVFCVFQSTPSYQIKLDKYRLLFSCTSGIPNSYSYVILPKQMGHLDACQSVH